MPLFQQLFRSLPTFGETDDRWYSSPFGSVYSDPSLAGRTVTKESALAMSVVYACITILSNSIASLQCYIYERQADGGRRRATERIADRILTRRPNGEMSHFRFKQVVMAHLAAWGNHYSYVERDDRGIRSALWPLFPDFITVRRGDRTGELEYVYHPPRGQERIFTPWEIFHIPGFGYSGLVGKSPITLAREAIGLGLAQEEFGARFYGDGTHPGLVATTPKTLKPTTATNLKDALLTQVGGLGKSHRLLLLQEDLKLHNISINPVDAEFIISRELQLQEICRFYRMPPHMVADLKRATFSNIENQGISFVVHTLGPWLSLLEAEFSFFFLTPDERKYFYFEFNVNKFLRGDIKSRFAAYQIARNSGWMNADEIRAKENENPMRDGLGKIYTVQAGVQSLDWLTGEPGEDGEEESPSPTPFTIVKMLRALLTSMDEHRERINSDTRNALKGGLADLEGRMTKVMSVHAEEFSGQLIKAASVIETAFTNVVSLQGEERIKEAVALMVAVKEVKKDLAVTQKRNAAEQVHMWDALGTLPGISDSVNALRGVIADSSAEMESQIEDVKSSIVSTSGKLSKKVSRDLRDLTDLATEARTRLDDGLTQLSENTTVEDAVSELQSVVVTVRGELIEKLGKIHLDTDPIVAIVTKSQEDVDARFTAVEEAIKAGITPKMLQGVVQEKFSEGLAGLLHRLDAVEGKLVGIVPEDVVKSIMEGESRAICEFIKGSRQEPVDLSPLEGVIKKLRKEIAEARQETVDLSPLEVAIKELGAQISEIPVPVEMELVDLSPLESAVKDISARINKIKEFPEPVDLTPLEDAVKALNIQITEGRQEPVDLSHMEGAIKDLGARINEIPKPVEAKRIDLAPLEDAIKSFSTRLDETKEPAQTVDLAPLESAIKDLDTRIADARQETVDLSPLEGAVKDLGGQFSDIRKQVQEGIKVPEPVDMEPVRSAIKNLGIRIAESRQEPVDLTPLEDAVKALNIQITEGRQEPVDLSHMEGAIKDLGAQINGIPKPVDAKPIDLTPLENAVRDFSTRLDETKEPTQTIDLSPLESAIKDLDTRIADARQEPVSLDSVEGAVKDLGARLEDIQGLVRERDERTLKLPEPVDLSQVEGAIKDLGTQSGELHGVMADAASNQAALVASISKIVDAQTQMVNALDELRSDGTDHGKIWTAKSEELGSLLTGLFEEIKASLEGLGSSVEELGTTSASKQTDQDKRLSELEKRVATRVVANREKVNSQYLPLIQDALQFILNRECIAVRRALKKFAGKREEMVRWLDDFYGAHPEFISIKMFSLFTSFLSALYTEVAIEDGQAGADIPEGFDSFIKDYFDGYVTRHMETSYLYLKGTAGNEDQTATNDMVDTWHNERAAKVAIEELGRAGEAIISLVEENADGQGS